MNNIISENTQYLRKTASLAGNRYLHLLYHSLDTPAVSAGLPDSCIFAEPMKQEELILDFTSATIGEAAHQLYRYAHQQRVWTFAGEMGAGKTTLIAALCRLLGVKDPVSSPTYALLNEYRYINEAGMQEPVFHMDWYRLKDPAEVINAGMEEALSGEHYCFVEWPERAVEILPRAYLQIRLSVRSETERVLHARHILL